MAEEGSYIRLLYASSRYVATIPAICEDYGYIEGKLPAVYSIYAVITLCKLYTSETLHENEDVETPEDEDDEDVDSDGVCRQGR